MTDHDDKILRSVRDIVEALGGASAVADLLGVGPTAVANWLSFDAIPPKWFFPISDALSELDRAAERDLFREHTRTARTANAS